jgi:enoyl-CoA hydratase
VTRDGFVRSVVQDHVLHVTLDRQPVNAIVPEVLDELRDVFSSVRDEGIVRAVLLASASERAFCAGMDTKARTQHQSGQPAPEREPDPGRRMRGALAAIAECAVPVVVAVNGPALGSGFGIVASCDIIVASELAAFGFPEVELGLLGGAAHLVRMVGPYRARAMYFRARRVTAQEMHAAGVVTEVVAPADLLASAGRIAGELAAMDPATLRLAKEAMNRVEGLSVHEGYRIEQDYGARLRGLRT